MKFSSFISNRIVNYAQLIHTHLPRVSLDNEPYYYFLCLPPTLTLFLSLFLSIQRVHNGKLLSEPFCYFIEFSVSLLYNNNQHEEKVIIRKRRGLKHISFPLAFGMTLSSFIFFIIIIFWTTLIYCPLSKKKLDFWKWIFIWKNNKKKAKRGEKIKIVTNNKQSCWDTCVG